METDWIEGRQLNREYDNIVVTQPRVRREEHAGARWYRDDSAAERQFVSATLAAATFTRSIPQGVAPLERR